MIAKYSLLQWLRTVRTARWQRHILQFEYDYAHFHSDDCGTMNVVYIQCLLDLYNLATAHSFQSPLLFRFTMVEDHQPASLLPSQTAVAGVQSGGGGHRPRHAAPGLLRHPGHHTGAGPGARDPRQAAVGRQEGGRRSDRWCHTGQFRGMIPEGEGDLFSLFVLGLQHWLCRNCML